MKTKYIIAGWVVDENEDPVGAVIDIAEAVRTEWCISESGWEIINMSRLNELAYDNAILFYHNDGATRYCDQEDVNYCQEAFGWNKRKTVKAYGKYLRLQFYVKQRFLSNIPDHRNIVFPIVMDKRLSEKCYVGFWHVDPQSVKKDLTEHVELDDKIFHLAGTCMIVDYTNPDIFSTYFETDCDFVQWHGQCVPESLKKQWLKSNERGVLK